MTNDLRSSLIEMYRTALSGCQTREQCMDLHADIKRMVRGLRDVQGEVVHVQATLPYANEVAREGRYE